MALTVSLTGDWMSCVGNKRAVDGTITFDSSYTTGGLAITAAQIGLGRIDFLEFDQGASGYIVNYDKTTGKVLVYSSAMGATFTGNALATHTHDMKYIGGITATEPVAIQGGDTLGKNAATDRTIAGANSATKGGVVAVSAGTPDGTITGGSTSEVSTNTNLSTLVVPFHAVGI